MKRVLILGAAGRDFHNFNVLFRDNSDYYVVAFTATQIPDIAGRRYPAELAGGLYPEGIPIFEEKDMEKLIAENKIDAVVFSYSDISHQNLMHLASRAVASDTDFCLLGTERTQVKSSVPVISVCAVRTGCGKSPVSRLVARELRRLGRKVVAIRHPMPYGDLAAQAVQRFATMEDLDLQQCTIEEREEYEPHIIHGTVVYAGVDYEKILRQAEKEADIRQAKRKRQSKYACALASAHTLPSPKCKSVKGGLKNPQSDPLTTQCGNRASGKQQDQEDAQHAGQTRHGSFRIRGEAAVKEEKPGDTAVRLVILLLISGSAQFSHDLHAGAGANAVRTGLDHVHELSSSSNSAGRLHAHLQANHAAHQRNIGSGCAGGGEAG